MLAIKRLSCLRQRPNCKMRCFIKDKRTGYVQVVILIDSLETTIKRIGNLSSKVYIGMESDDSFGSSSDDDETAFDIRIVMLGVIFIMYIILMLLRREKHHCETSY